jgi:hypothetical protein
MSQHFPSNYEYPWNLWALLHESSLKEVPRPEWLSESGVDVVLPVNELLTDSVYYPGSATDGDPIKHLGRYFWSFVYADYGFTRDEIRKALDSGEFGGYKVSARRAVTENELPLEQWNAETGGRFAYGLPLENNAPPFFRRGVCPFAEWVLLEDRSVRPRRVISLLFFGADGVALLEKLYASRGISPACICVIQAPPALGGFNWTTFEDERGPLFQTLTKIKSGLPRFLLYGGSGDPEWYKKPCWSAYTLRLAWPLARMRNWRPDGALSFWERIAEEGNKSYCRLGRP